MHLAANNEGPTSRSVAPGSSFLRGYVTSGFYPLKREGIFPSVMEERHYLFAEQLEGFGGLFL